MGNANPEAGRVGDGLFYHWRMRHAAWLLLRRDQKDAESDPPTAAERSAYLSQVMHRLQLASDGRWNQLIVEATDALAAVRPRAPPTNGQTYGEWSEWQLSRAATLSLAQGTRAAADVLLGEPAVPPSTELVGEMAELFRTQPPSADERAKRSELLTRISVAPRYAKRKVTASVAARQVDAARPMAGPGPSGLRNSHLSAMRRLPQGPATLAAWAQVWAQGQIEPMLAQIWTDQVVRPFYKPSPDAEPSRPISCGEALLKFALGCVSRWQGAGSQTYSGTNNTVVADVLERQRWHETSVHRVA